MERAEGLLSCHFLIAESTLMLVALYEFFQQGSTIEDRIGAQFEHAPYHQLIGKKCGPRAIPLVKLNGSSTRVT